MFKAVRLILLVVSVISGIMKLRREFKGSR
jgi:hypothetical protein